VFPAGDAEHNVCVGYLFGIYYSTFTLEPVCSVTSCFGYGLLIDLADAGQDYIKLVIDCWISKSTVGVFA
jgi:hypothetical protein